MKSCLISLSGQKTEKSLNCPIRGEIWSPGYSDASKCLYCLDVCKVYPQVLRTYSMNQKSLRANFLKSDLVAGFSISSDFIKSLQRNVKKTDFR